MLPKFLHNFDITQARTGSYLWKLYNILSSYRSCSSFFMKRIADTDTLITPTHWNHLPFRRKETRNDSERGGKSTERDQDKLKKQKLHLKSQAHSIHCAKR